MSHRCLLTYFFEKETQCHNDEILSKHLLSLLFERSQITSYYRVSLLPLCHKFCSYCCDIVCRFIQDPSPPLFFSRAHEKGLGMRLVLELFLCVNITIIYIYILDTPLLTVLRDSSTE